jgi:hypothetical protein
MAHLTALDHLRELRLCYIGTDDTDPAFLPALPELETLAFQYTVPFPWEQAAARVSSLRELSLHNVLPENMAPFAHLPRLTDLTLSGYPGNRAKREAVAREFAQLAPWCRITLFDGHPKDNPAVIEPTAPPPVSTAPPPDARSAGDGSLDRRVAQRLLDLKLPVRLVIAGTVHAVKPGSSLPADPFQLSGIGAGASAAVPRADLMPLFDELRKLTQFDNTYLPQKDCDLWAEALSSMPSIRFLNASRCDELTDVGAARLARLPKLTYVNLGNSPKITGAGLAAFHACPTLTTIELCPEAMAAGTYAPADVQRLQDALPKTRVVFIGMQPIPGLKPAAP